MKPYYADEAVRLWAGDCLDVMRAWPDSSVDSVVCDPPYGLEFMGHAWDRYTPRAFQQWCQSWATECLRVLKPGGHLLAFGGSRTAHRLASGIEDVGFEMRDSITWLYGSGFPKSLNVSKAVNKMSTEGPPITFQTRQGDLVTITSPSVVTSRSGWGTALKPAQEPIVMARKPLSGTVAANVLAYGTGALNIDGCRVGTSGGGTSCPSRDIDGECVGHPAANGSLGGGVMRHGADASSGRWPSNVVLSHGLAADGSDACADGCLPGCAVRELDAQSGVSESKRAERGAGKIASATYGQWGTTDDTTRGHMDSGGASRFFPTFRYEAKAPTMERPRADEVAHPTVKPLDLMRWLVRLVTPPGGLCADPFAGSGTTAEACVIEGMRCWTVEQHEPYLPLIVARLSKPIQPDLFGGAA